MYNTVETSLKRSQESLDSYPDDTSEHPANPNTTPIENEFHHDFKASNLNNDFQKPESASAAIGESAQTLHEFSSQSKQSQLQHILLEISSQDDLLDVRNSWKPIYNSQKTEKTLAEPASEISAQSNLNKISREPVDATGPPVFTKEKPKDNVKVGHSTVVESKPSNIDYLFQYSDDEVGTEDPVEIENAFQSVPKLQLMSGALPVTSDILNIENRTALKTNDGVVEADCHMHLNSAATSIVQNSQPDVIPHSQDNQAANSDMDGDLWKKNVDSTVESHGLHMIENPSTDASLSAPADSLRRTQDPPPTETPEFDYTPSSLPIELEKAPASIELIREGFEDNQITRFNDKAFRKALRELNPDLPRKMQWYAWNKVNVMLKSDDNQDCESNQSSVKFEYSPDVDQRDFEEASVFCACEGNSADCTCAPDNCKCLRCPKSNAQRFADEANDLIQEDNVHCLCVGGPFRCSRCEGLVDGDDTEELKVEEETRVAFIKQETLRPSNLSHNPISQSPPAQVQLPGLTYARSSGYACEETEQDEDAYSTKLETDEDRTRFMKTDDVKVNSNDRPWEHYNSYDKIQTPEDQMKKTFEQTPNQFRSPSYESSVPSQAEEPIPVEYGVRQSVEPEMWARPSFKESTPAYEDRSHSPSPASYINENDVQMEDYSPSAHSPGTPLQCPTPTTAEPTETQGLPTPHRIICPPPIPMNDHPLRPSKRDGRRKSAVQGSKIEKSPTKSRNVTQKHGIARKVTGKKKAEEKVGTKVKDAVAKIETGLQEQQKKSCDDVDGKGGDQQETTPRRSSRIKAIKLKRSMPKLPTLH